MRIIAPTKEKDGMFTIKKEVREFCPKKFSDVEEIVDRVQNKEGVLIVLEEVPYAVAQRMLDFLGGVMFALCGSVRKVRDKQYLLIPDGVTITALGRKK